MDPPADARGAHRRARLLPLSVPPAPAPPAGAIPLGMPDAAGWYLPLWLCAAAAAEAFAELASTLDWRTHRLRLFGREVETPRRCAWYGDPGARYRYSGLTLEPLRWTRRLADLRAALEALTGTAFNAVLANLYRDGRDRMGWHADDEPELGPEPVVASLSLGAPRRFLLRHRSRKDLPTQSLTLEPGSLLVMAGATQRHWKHALPPSTRVRAARINLTFRQVQPAAAARRPRS